MITGTLVTSRMVFQNFKNHPGPASSHPAGSDRACRAVYHGLFPVERLDDLKTVMLQIHTDKSNHAFFIIHNKDAAAIETLPEGADVLPAACYSLTKPMIFSSSWLSNISTMLILSRGKITLTTLASR